LFPLTRQQQQTGNSGSDGSGTCNASCNETSAVCRLRLLVRDFLRRQVETGILAMAKSVIARESWSYFLRRREEFAFSHESGPCSVAMPTHALPSRRLKHDTRYDGLQRVGPVWMLFVVYPIQSKPDGRNHRTR